MRNGAGCMEANPQGHQRGIRTPGYGHYSEVAKAERSFVKQLLKNARELLFKGES